MKYYYKTYKDPQGIRNNFVLLFRPLEQVKSFVDTVLSVEKIIVSYDNPIQKAKDKMLLAAIKVSTRQGDKATIIKDLF